MDNGHADYDPERKMYSWRGSLLPLGREAALDLQLKITSRFAKLRSL